MKNVRCIETVIMKDDGGSKAFTEGIVYAVRELVEKHIHGENGLRKVIEAVNDDGEKHNIKYVYSDKLDGFFEKHFVGVD